MFPTHSLAFPDILKAKLAPHTHNTKNAKKTKGKLRRIYHMSNNMKIIITGGTGFLGQHLIKKLHQHGHTNIISLGTKNYDFREPTEVATMYNEHKPDIVIHLAAKVGGIGANSKYPGTFYYDNIMMGTLLLHHAMLNKIKKFVAIGTICAYPKYTKIPFKENDLWEGYPEETNAAYGVAKRAMLVQCQAYRKEFGLNAIYLLPVNLYGPGDNFNPESSHVIPALIKKFVEAKANNNESVEIWGTGNASREFLYVEDAAEAITLATENYESSEPMNIGTGQEIKISELVKLIQTIIGYQGHIHWDNTKPDGQPRRCLDISKMKNVLGYTPQTTFMSGMHNTIDWYYSWTLQQQSQSAN